MSRAALSGLVALLVSLGARASAQIPLGVQFQVNGVAEGYQTDPAVELGADGKAVVVWQDSDIPFTAGWVNYKQLDSANRTLHEGHANEMFGSFSVPKMSMSKAGDALVAWYRSYRWIGADGLPASSEVVFEEGQVEYQNGFPDVDLVSERSFALVDQGFLNEVPFPSTMDIFARIVGPTGELLGPFRVNEDLAGEQYQPRVAAAEDGSFVVVWNDGGGVDGDGFGILARRYDHVGVALGSEFVVNEHRAGDQSLCDVAMDDAGNWVVTWADAEGPPNGSEIVYRRFDAGGAPLTPELKANQHAAEGQSEPTIAMDARGNFVIAWHDFLLANGEFSEVMARLFRPDGTPLGDEFRVSLGAPEDYDELPNVALSSNGSFLVTWQGWRETGHDEVYDIEARRFFRGCRPEAEGLELHGGRFEVCAGYRTPAGAQGVGEPIPLTAESGGFWFFTPENLEVVLKLLDGCGTNGNFWIYSAGLTDLEVTVGVIDTWSGQTWVFDNDQATPFPPIGEITSLPVCGATPNASPTSVTGDMERSALPLVDRAVAGRLPELTVASESACVADPTHLCLQGDRFRVSARYATPGGNVGDAQAVALSSDSGALWFFWPENLELFVKVLDACGLPDFESFWVYAAGLTDLEVELTVVDMRTGEPKFYRNPQYRPFPAVLDSQAFASCDAP